MRVKCARFEQQLGPPDPEGSQVLPLRTEMRVGFSSMRTEIAEQGKGLREDIAGLGTQMRVLHEDVIGPVALLQAGHATSAQKSRKK